MAESVQSAWEWVRREPAVLLAGVLNWIPGLLFSAAALSVAPQIRVLFTPNRPNPIAGLMAHSHELLQWILPFLLFFLVLFLIALLSSSIVSLALAYAAEQFQSQKPLSLTDAFASAWKRLKKLLASEVILWGAVLAVVLLTALISVLLIISIVGIVLLVILAIPAIIAVFAGGIVLAAMQLFLPAIVAFQNAGSANSVKASFRFVRQNKMASGGLVVLSIGGISVLNLFTNAIGGMGGSIISMTGQLVIGSLVALAATSYWLDAQKTLKPVIEPDKKVEPVVKEFDAEKRPKTMDGKNPKPSPRKRFQRD